MTGIMNLRLKPTNIKKNTYPIYKMDIKNMERLFLKAQEKKLIKDC